MLDFIWEWRFVIVLVIAFILILLFEWQKGKAVLYALMLQAKRMAKDCVLSSGREQEKWVVKKAMLFLPIPLKTVFSEKLVRNIVKWLFSKLKDYMDDGQLNKSFSR